MRNKTLLLNLMLLVLTSCVSAPRSVDTTYWKNLVASEQFQKEKTTYTDRLGGKFFCWNNGINEYFKASTPPPNKNCLYPASKMVTQLDDAMVFYNKVIGQRINQLKVMQSTPEGYLITSTNVYEDQVLFIHKTDESDVVDGAFLDTTNWIFYEYTGVYSYKTALASKTVHSFKKLTKKQTEMAGKDLEVFSPTIEYWVQNDLWTYLEGIAVPYKKAPTKQ